MPVPSDISWTVLRAQAGPLQSDSEKYRKRGQFFICVGTSQSGVALTSVHCAHVSELLEQPDNATCRPSFVLNSVLSCLTLNPFN